MKLYKVTRMVEEGGEVARHVAGWTTSETDAKKLCTKYRKNAADNEPAYEPFEVPTTRTELVAFLNAFAAPAFGIALE